MKPEFDKLFCAHIVNWLSAFNAIITSFDESMYACCDIESNVYDNISIIEYEVQFKYNEGFVYLTLKEYAAYSNHSIVTIRNSEHIECIRQIITEPQHVLQYIDTIHEILHRELTNLIQCSNLKS